MDIIDFKKTRSALLELEDALIKPQIDPLTSLKIHEFLLQSMEAQTNIMKILEEATRPDESL